jgi:hypothetical protein
MRFDMDKARRATGWKFIPETEGVGVEFGHGVVLD